MNIQIETGPLTRLRELAVLRSRALTAAHALDEQGLHTQASKHHEQAEDLDRELAENLIELLDLKADTPPPNHVDGADELADLAELVDGQGAMNWCGCGSPITMYEGVWLHVYNPALIGADDHDAHP